MLHLRYYDFDSFADSVCFLKPCRSDDPAGLSLSYGVGTWHTNSYNEPMMTIREARREDAELMMALVRGLAEYEREPDAVKIGAEQLARDAFPEAGGERYFECLIAEADGQPAGMAIYFPVYSTWRGRCLHLEDLFVRPAFRGRGIGKALLTRVAAIAVERGCAKLFWHVLDWNQPAIDFYKSLGAEPLEEWTRMQLVDQALERVARMSDDAIQASEAAV